MRRLARAAVISVLGAAIGCGGSSYGGGGPSGGCISAVATATTTVTLQGMQFVPVCVKVAKGATVTWTNADTIVHTVTEDSGQPEPFDSGTLGPGQSYSHTFGQTAATHEIHCRIHGTMTETVLVE
jgi:plastocyanin